MYSHRVAEISAVIRPRQTFEKPLPDCLNLSSRFVQSERIRTICGKMCAVAIPTSRGLMRRTWVYCLFVASLSSFALFAVSAIASPPQSKEKSSKPAAMASYGNSESITQDELKVYDYFLASDQLEGRNFPSRGYDTAALYVASHLAEWGLKPGGSTTGTNGPLQPYLMPIELSTRSVVAEESLATITAPAPAGRGGGGGGPAGTAEMRSTKLEYGK